jgi:CheY-like chemotaxis protein/nitrogen-specific signal transduction histidine kinase
MEDVTRKRALDDLLKQAKETAEEANRIKSEFLANMSHELRTPLAGIMSLSDILLADSREDQQERLRSIRSSASSLLSMLNDLLDLSKIEARTVELRVEDFDLQECATITLAPFKASAEQKGLTFRILVEDGGFPFINTDRGRLAQIVSNLVANAVKFTDSGSVDIRFAVRAKDDVPALFVSVRDTGIGISGIDQQKLFKHFAQVDGALSRKYGGTGLGLAISKELVLRMGGDIWVESAPGLGSTFSFYIPVKAAGISEASPEDEDFPIAPRSYTLLLAEDNPVNRDYLRFFLEKAGHRVAIASDGYEALSSLEKGDFDAILMDIQMPGLDGIEATTTIRAYTGSSYDPHIPVIALTAFAEEELGTEYLGASFDAHATKPINPRSLVGLIEATLRKKDRFDVDRIKRQYAASVDEFRRLLMIAMQDLPKRIAAFEAAHAADDADAAKVALHGVVNVLSAIGAVRALQLVKRYRKAVVEEDRDVADYTASDLLAEVEGIRQQVKKALAEL